MAQDEEEVTESPMPIEFVGESHLIQRKSKEMDESPSNPDRVWVQQTQAVPKVKFQEKPDIIHEDHDE